MSALLVSASLTGEIKTPANPTPAPTNLTNSADASLLQPANPARTQWIVSFKKSIDPSDAWLSSANPLVEVDEEIKTAWLRRASGNARLLQLDGPAKKISTLIDTLKKHPAVLRLDSDAWVTTADAANVFLDASGWIKAVDKPASLKAGVITNIPSEKLPDPGQLINDTNLAIAAATGEFRPDDPLFQKQWQLHKSLANSAAINALDAWEVTQGSTDTVVAVIDTGVRLDHPDLQGRLLPGYDFVSAIDNSREGTGNLPSSYIYARANDGDGRDDDPTDTGDGAEPELVAYLAQYGIACKSRDSTWHGTGVASIIAANANDGIGVAGLDWNAMILPVRAIGRCGGRRSDLLDSIRWAAGIEDPALPPNPTPAHIINLSLGIDDVCTGTDQAAINDAVLAGAIVVSAVGNQGRNTSAEPSSPSQCHNVLGVSATEENGYIADYSNHGQDADIAAPGGSRYPSNYGVDVATNGGRYTDNGVLTWKRVSGTSVSAPLVSGTLALMRSLQPTLNGHQLIQLLLQSTVAFPDHNEHLYGPPCTPDVCGVGLLNTNSAVRAALNYQAGTNPVVDDAIFDDSPAPFGGVVIIGAGSGFGCTSFARTTYHTEATHSPQDPLLFVLLIGAVLVLTHRFRQRVTLTSTHAPT